MLYNTSGEILALAFRESRLHHPEPGATTQDPEEMFSSTFEGIQECLEKTGINPSDVAAIVLDGQQSGLMWIDQEYNAVSPYDSWLDSRYGPYVEEMTSRCGDRILEKTGTNKSFVHGPKILWWKKNRPEVFKNAYKMVLPASYIGGRLAGLKGKDAYFEETSLGFSGICDLNNSVWDKEICEIVGIPYEKLPRIVESTEIVGGLCKKYADLLGLPQGIPIVSGGGDFPVATLGAGICESGQTGDLAGTASIFFACLDQWKPDPAGVIRTLKSPIPGLWLPFGLMSGGGCVRWYRDTFYQKEKEEIGNVYKFLEDKIKDIPVGCNGLGFYPYIGGKHSNPDYGGAWIGIQWEHQREHFYRAILESIAYEYNFYSTSIKNILDIKEFKETRVFGGGSADNTWNQIKADVLGTPYITLEQQECSLLGSAIVAGYAIGIYSDLVETSKRMNKTVKRLVPNSKNHKLYDNRYQNWFHLYQTQGQFLRGV
jgi:xylulokinase